MNNKKYIFDACAVIAFVKDEPGADIIENLLIQARDELCYIVMSKFNLLEVYYGFYYSNGREYAENILKEIVSMPISFIDNISNATFKEAGRIKANHKISLADTILLAESIVNNAAVVSADHHELDKIEKNENINFLWFR